MPKGYLSSLSAQTGQCTKYTCCLQIKTTWPFLGLLNRQDFHSQGSALLEEYFKNYFWSSSLKDIQYWSKIYGWLCTFIWWFWKDPKLTNPFQHQPINALQVNVVFNPTAVIPCVISFAHWYWASSIFVFTF